MNVVLEEEGGCLRFSLGLTEKRYEKFVSDWREGRDRSGKTAVDGPDAEGILGDFFLGKELYYQSKWGEALDSFTSSLIRSPGEAFSAVCCYRIAVVFFEQGLYDQSMVFLRRCRETALRFRPRLDLYICLADYVQAKLFRYFHEMALAREKHRSAVKFAPKAASISGLTEMEGILMLDSDPSGALKLFDSILSARNPRPSRYELANCHYQKARALLGMKRDREAAASLDEAERIWSKEIGDRRGEGYVSRLRGRMATHLDDLEGAEKAFDTALEKFSEIGYYRGVLIVHITRAEVCERTFGDPVRAISAYRNAERYCEMNPLSLAPIYLGLARLLDAIGQWEQRDEYLAKFDDVFRSKTSVRGRIFRTWYSRFFDRDFEETFLPSTVRKERERMTGELKKKSALPRDTAADVVGHSLMQMIGKSLRPALTTKAPVLLTGESGTGKDKIARYIHDHGIRKAGQFVMINCPAIPQERLEAELFGYEKGAFPGAAALKKGQMEMADKGTLFMNEIGDIKFDLQAKLLTALETGGFMRVGGVVRIKPDFRLICATNRDMPRMVEEGTFREDLYFRIHVLHIPLPPLRKRPEDIPPLIRHLMERIARENGYQRELRPSDGLMGALKRSFLKGNVRELSNLLLTAMENCRNEGREIVGMEDMVIQNSPESGEPAGPGKSEDGSPVSYAGHTVLVHRASDGKLLMKDREFFLKACADLGFRKSRIAAHFKISRPLLDDFLEREDIRIVKKKLA